MSTTPPPTTASLTFLGDLVPSLGGITYASARIYCRRHGIGVLIGNRRFLIADEVTRLRERPKRGNQSGKSRLHNH